MADVTITAANVQVTANTLLATAIANVAISAGKTVAIDATTKKAVLYDADLAGSNIAAGVAVNSTAASQVCVYAVGGDIVAGGTLVKGTTYVGSATAGGLAPQADLTTGANLGIIGFARDTTTLAVVPLNPGITF